MQVLEKILEEIRKAEKEYVIGQKVWYSLGATGMATEISNIIRSHMDEVSNCGECSRRKWYQKGYEDGRKDNNWIPVEERLPKRGKLVRVTVHTSEWIGDYESNWVREQDKMYHPEEYNVYDGYLRSDGTWIFYDEYNEETTCVKEFGKDKGRIYDVVTAWMSVKVPEPYKPERDNDGA